MKQKLLSSLLLTALLCGAQDLVKNGKFNANAEYGAMPPEWTSQTADAWHFLNDDGITNEQEMPSCIEYKGNGTELQPATQKIKLKPNSTYVISASIKLNGTLPSVVLTDLKGKRKTSLSPDRDISNLWQDCIAEFSTYDVSDYIINLVGSSSQTNGTSRFDNIIIMEGDRSSLEKAERPEAVFKPAGENIALGKSYTWTKIPNYGLTKDPDDNKQLTDGVYTKGFFWGQKNTVGWSYASQLEIVVDLEKEEPICGASWNCAAGTSSVTWPSNINLFVSQDGKNWERVGDLTLLALKHSMPAPNGYSTFKYATNELKTKGRYFMFQVIESPFTFVDEIQIFRGPDAWLDELHPEYAITNTKNFASDTIISSGVIKRMSTDLIQIERLLKGLKEPARSEALAKAEDLKKQLDYKYEGGEFKAIFPLSDTHEKILALNAYLLQSLDFSKPFLWHSNRWSTLAMSALPPKSDMPALEVEMIRNEVRSEVINICNPTFAPIDYTIYVDGIPEGANLELCEVLVTDTNPAVAIAAALKQSEKSTLEMTVQAGCSRQVWIRFNRPSAKAGKYAGKVHVKSAEATLQADIVLNLHDFTFPKRPLMHVGGWDYTNGEGHYYKSMNNLDANLAIMRDIYTDSPWGTPGVVPSGAKFDKDGHLLNADAIDYTKWDAWLARWNDARNYCVFWNSPESMGQHPMGTAPFNTAVGEFMNAWTEHMKAQGKSPEQLVILIRDEPNNHKQDTVIIHWAKAISAAKTGAKTFEDPLYTDPTQGIPEMFSSVDILCPNTSHRSAKLRDFFIKQREAGRVLWLYECSGPAKLLDTMNYHRAQCWYAYEFGAYGTFYWAFGCGGGIGDSWDCYSQTGVEYSPYFVSQTSTMHGKHSEAIREGVQDFEYLHMLEDRIAALRKEGRDADADKAQAALDKAFNGAIEGLQKSYGSWTSSKDHDVLDRARISILKALEEAR